MFIEVFLIILAVFIGLACGMITLVVGYGICLLIVGATGIRMPKKVINVKEKPSGS